MKTRNLVTNVLKVVALLSMTVMMANCQNGGSNNNNANMYGRYQMMNGQCYMNNNGSMQPVAYNLCTSAYGAGYGTGYGYGNGYGAMFPNCNTGYSTGAMMTQMCMGPMTDGMQVVQCGTQFNCSGYTLYNQSCQIVRCQ